MTGIETGFQRIVVVGTTGSGKTTVAGRLERILGISHVELDSLNWEPNWTSLAEIDPDRFRQRVREAVSVQAWVVDGSYSVVRDLVWPKATMLVWLDYPLRLILWRLLLRTLRRIVTKEVLWSGNQESFHTQFFSRQSLFLWLLQTHPRRRRTYPGLLAQPEHAHLQVVRLYSPSETERWLRRIQVGGPAHLELVEGPERATGEDATP